MRPGQDIAGELVLNALAAGDDQSEDVDSGLVDDGVQHGADDFWVSADVDRRGAWARPMAVDRLATAMQARLAGQFLAAADEGAQ